MATIEERKEIERQVRAECARIASLEAQYWSGVDNDGPTLQGISIGAIGAASNIASAIFMGKTAFQVADEIEQRDHPELEK